MEAIEKEIKLSSSHSSSDLRAVTVKTKGKGKQQKQKKGEDGVDEKAFDEVCVCVCVVSVLHFNCRMTYIIYIQCFFHCLTLSSSVCLSAHS